MSPINAFEFPNILGREYKYRGMPVHAGDLAELKASIAPQYQSPRPNFVPDHLRALFSSVLSELHLSLPDITLRNWESVYLKVRRILERVGVS